MSVDTRLDELLSRWQTLRARGADVPADELCRDCPDLVPEVERRLSALRQLDQLAPARSTVAALDPPPALPGAPTVGPLPAADVPADAVPADGVPMTRSAMPASLGRFQIQALLGAGGFAKVYRAYDPDLERPVAIKVPHANFERLDLLRREARLAAKLRHPAIVQIYEICSNTARGAGNDEPAVYLVMQYVEGVSLAKRLDQGPVDRDWAVGLVLDVAEAVGYAHAQGVLHRDLKPHNILLDVNGRPYVTDFGLAVRQETLAAHVGEGYGTPAYMSPEQASGQHLTPASDLWSLGVVLYEMLVQQRPFGSHPAEVFRRLGKEDAAPPSALDSTVPQDLEHICMRCLARNPAQRYATAQELIADLRKWKSQRAVGPSDADLQHAERYYKQALGYMEAGDLTLATDRLQHAVRLNGDLGAAHYLLGLCHLLSDDDVRIAVEALTRATDLDRDNHAAHFVLANVYYALEAFHLAARHADQALAGKPADQTYRDYQKRVRHRLDTTPVSDSGKRPDVQYQLEPARRRHLADVADAVFHRTRTSQLKLRHWLELHWPWRTIARHPLIGSLAVSAACYAVIMALHAFAWDNRHALQFAVASALTWPVIYGPFLIARMLETTYARLLPVVNMPEDAFRRFYIQQVAHILGGTCVTPPSNNDGVVLAWRHNRPQLLITLGFLPVMLALQYICADEFPLPITAAKLAVYLGATFQGYVSAWVMQLAVASVFFVPRFSRIPVRYFLGMPAALSLASLGSFFVRLSWVGCAAYLGFIAQHYVFRTYQAAPAVSVAYTAIGMSWAIAICIISQVQIHLVLKELKARRMLEYSYHVEDAFERAMKNPTDKGFAQLRAHQEFMTGLRRLSTRGLASGDLLQFLLIVAIFVVITLIYAYLVLHELWWV